MADHDYSHYVTDGQTEDAQITDDQVVEVQATADGGGNGTAPKPGTVTVQVTDGNGDDDEAAAVAERSGLIITPGTPMPTPTGDNGQPLIIIPSGSQGGSVTVSKPIAKPDEGQQSRFSTPAGYYGGNANTPYPPPYTPPDVTRANDPFDRDWNTPYERY